MDGEKRIGFVRAVESWSTALLGRLVVREIVARWLPREQIHFRTARPILLAAPGTS
jgi:hypothetical protein